MATNIKANIKANIKTNMTRDMTTKKTSSPSLIILEGNIGVGKSTFLTILKQELGLDILYEPHEKWQKGVIGGNLLEKFYQDINRWGYTFQTYAFISRIMTIREYEEQNPGNSMVILERSVFSDRYCFARNCFEMGFMTALEWNLYKDLFDWLIMQFMPKPAGFIYLHATPNVCFERIAHRQRQEEMNISLDYLQRLDNLHDSWLINKEEVLPAIKDIPVLELNCSQDFQHDKLVQQRHLREVTSFLELITQQTFIRPELGTKQQKNSLPL
jgi:deoxyadenosine/deoxycytidine kinase